MVSKPPSIVLRTVVLDCLDAHALAGFYKKLLGWEWTLAEPDWVLMRNPDGSTGLSFQGEPDYVRPVWPEEPGEQQKMLHLDFQVEDLPMATDHAIACGATMLAVNSYPGVNVLMDPEGHPFCLFLN